MCIFIFSILWCVFKVYDITNIIQCKIPVFLVHVEKVNFSLQCKPLPVNVLTMLFIFVIPDEASRLKWPLD